LRPSPPLLILLENLTTSFTDSSLPSLIGNADSSVTPSETQGARLAQEGSYPSWST
jgi:hypothetical protein